MRHSNVYESFLSFLSSDGANEKKRINERIYAFLMNNRQFGYDNDTKLPGLAALDRISQEIAVPVKKLRSFIKNDNYPNARLVSVNSVVWDGDIVAFTASDSKSGNGYRGSGSSDYRASSSDYEEFSAYRNRRSYNGSKRMYRRADESLLSDFKRYVRSIVTRDSQDYDLDDALGRILYFLTINPDYDYHELSDTPGLIFASTLSGYTRVPYKVILDIFKTSPFENSTVIQFKSRDINAPVIVFGRPSISRKDAFNAWKSEGQVESPVRSKFEDQPSMNDVPPPAPSAPSTASREHVVINPNPNVVVDDNKAYEIAAEEKARRLDALIKDTITHLDALVEGFDPKKIKKPEQQTIKETFEDINDKKKEISIRDTIAFFISQHPSLLKRSDIFKGIFKESDNTPNEFYVIEDISSASLKLATFLWNETPRIFIEKLQS